jgi:hypothetical protein
VFGGAAAIHPDHPLLVNRIVFLSCLQVALKTIPPDLRSVVACLTAEGADSDTFNYLTTLYLYVSGDLSE